MDPERFQELLPWLANGTLTPADRDAMVAYLVAHPEARGDVRETAYALVAVGGHPAVGWLAETARDASFEHRAEVLNHLAACADCAEAVALARVAHATPPITFGAVAASLPPAAAPFGPRPTPRRRRMRATRVLALAAMLIASIGLGRFWESLDPPPTRVVVADVAAPEAGSIAALRAVPVSVSPSTLRGGSGGNELELGPDRDAFMVEVQLPTVDQDVIVLGARLETLGGELVTALSPGPRFAGDFVNVMIPSADLLADTEYVLVVEDVETGRVLDRYPLRTGPLRTDPLRTDPLRTDPLRTGQATTEPLR